MTQGLMAQSDADGVASSARPDSDDADASRGGAAGPQDGATIVPVAPDEGVSGASTAAVRRRDPRLAAALSFVPGLGQAYNGQGGKAGFFFLATLLTIGPAVLLIMFGEHLGTTLLTRHEGSLFLLFAFLSIVVFLALFLLGLTFWASSAVDARRSAEELNRGDSAAAGRWWFFRL